jgi:Tfp pilus assembly protein PilF
MTTARPLALLLMLGAAVLGAAGCSASKADDGRAALTSGKAYFAKKQYREASLEFRRALQANPTMGEASLGLAETLLELQEIGPGIKEYYRAADMLPENTKVQLRAGGFLLLQGKFDDARSRAQSVVNREPQNVDAQILLANALAGLKDVDGAIRDMETAVKADPKNAAPFRSLADFHVMKGNSAAAEAALRRVLELEPGSARGHLALAAFFWGSARMADAEATLKQGLDRNPGHRVLLRALMLFYFETGRPTEAEFPLTEMAKYSKDQGDRLEVADYLMALGQVDKAKAIAEDAVRDKTWGPAARVRLATLLLAKGRAKEAAEGVDAVLAAEPRNTDALMLKARMTLSVGDLSAAAALAKQAVDSNRRNADAHLLYGGILLQRGETEAARSELNEATTLNSRATQAFLQLAQIELSRGAASAAAGYASQALRTQPGNPTIRLLLVRSLLAAGDSAKADVELRSLAKDYPKAAGVQATLGALYMMKENAPAARKALTRALEIDPTHIEALASLAMLDLQDNHGADAIARIDRRVSEVPKSAPILMLAARIHRDAGDNAGAIDLLKRVVDVDAERIDAYTMLAEMYASQRKLTEARLELDKVLKRQPASRGARTFLGMVYELEGKAADAIATYEEVLAANPSSGVAANNLAALLIERTPEDPRILDLAQTAKGALPDDWHVNDTLGWAMYHRGMFERAVAPLEQSAAANPRDATVMYHLAMAYARNGQIGQAQETLAKAAALRPDMKELAEARKLLGAPKSS